MLQTLIYQGFTKRKLEEKMKMTKVYGIILKYWIEDHYEQEELFEKKLFTSYEKAMEYLLSNIKCDSIKRV